MRAQTGYHNTEVPPGLQKGTTWSFTNQAQRVTKRPTVPQNITAQSCRPAAPPTRPRSPPHGEGRAQRREAGRPHEAPQRSTAPRGRSVTVVLREQPPRLQVELLLADLLLEPELQVGPVPAGDREQRCCGSGGGAAGEVEARGRAARCSLLHVLAQRLAQALLGRLQLAHVRRHRRGAQGHGGREEP